MSTPTYPGVYVQEVPSAVHTITGVATSNAAFVDFFPAGPAGTAVKITSWAQFERIFGGLDQRSEASYAIMQFLTYGGSTAFVVRAVSGAQSATVDLPAQQYGYGYAAGYAGAGWSGAGGAHVLTVTASSPGAWGGQLRVGVDYNVKGGDPDLFNLVVQQVQVVNNRTQVLQSEIYRNLTLDSSNLASYAPQVVNQASILVTISDQTLGGVPDQTGPDVINNPPDGSFVALTGGNDGTSPQDGWTADLLLGDQLKQTGIYALEAIAPDVFNIMCIPATALLDADNLAAVIAPVQAYCASKRAMYILDLPAAFDETPSYDGQLSAITNFTNDVVADNRDSGTVLYVPRLTIADPLNQNRSRGVGASGTLAGIWAKTDATGAGGNAVWLAPAGTQAALPGNVTLACNLTDADHGTFNQLGVNVLRSFPLYGNLSWGARTLMGADVEASEWKYVPVRRTAYYIEESLVEGLKWVVFQPNDEDLWRKIRLNVTAFLQTMYLNQAFPGQTPAQCYFVKCDADTNPQAQIDLGIVTVIVGFAPLLPAEFVILQIEQMAGQS